MLRLRPYKPQDAKYIISWLKDVNVFELWGGKLFGNYPINEDIINNKYYNNNGDCAEPDNFYPFIAFDESGVVGHFIMRYLNGDNKLFRFGWVIVDDTKRDQKYGQEMLKLGLKYAFDVLKADKVNLGVYENNPLALNCYLKAGFHDYEGAPEKFDEVDGEKVKIIELEISKSEYYSD
ncbi:MAG: GNAT family N-acetyltransferase [Lachnospiraceae bacterium]|nr:GNAT family N-acetyltransferase [Lachnospiraceae bacterium]